jgi:hypothetical protein
VTINLSGEPAGSDVRPPLDGTCPMRHVTNGFTPFEAPYLTDIESTSHGIFAFRMIDPGVEDAVLCDPLSLADSTRFYNGTGLPDGPRPWRTLDDGGVYGTITLPQSEIQAIARYSVPGTVPSDLIFRNAFD